MSYPRRNSRVAEQCFIIAQNIVFQPFVIVHHRFLGSNIVKFLFIINKCKQIGFLVSVVDLYNILSNYKIIYSAKQTHNSLVIILYFPFRRPFYIICDVLYIFGFLKMYGCRQKLFVNGITPNAINVLVQLGRNWVYTPIFNHLNLLALFCFVILSSESVDKLNMQVYIQKVNYLKART